MVEKFHSELESLRKEVLDMGYLARDMLAGSIEALNSRDPGRAEWVESNTQRIAEYDSDIEQKCLRLIALYQPMAKDLRVIATILKMNTYLTRIGRYGKDISEVATGNIGTLPIAHLEKITRMSDITGDMIRDALTDFEVGEIIATRDIGERDDIVDSLRYSVFRGCVTDMMQDPGTIAACANYIMIARYLERCGDLACKIAEKVFYMVTGERIEINRKKVDEHEH